MFDCYILNNRIPVRQGLAIREHEDGSGNFKQLLLTRKADIFELGPWLERKYDLNSPTVQN